jgi:hypothetical protein
MKKLTVLTVTLIIGLLVNSASAQNRTVGVSPNDAFKYTYNLDMSVSNSSFTLPTILESLIDQAKTIEWAKITVLNVTDTTVTAQMLTHFTNDTEQTNIGETNVQTGQGNLTMFLISANLTPNDSIYVGGNSAINETVSETYPSGSRETSRQSIISEYNLTENELAGFNLTELHQTNTQVFSWDKTTGMLTAMSLIMVSESPNFNANISVDVKLVESNVFAVPEYPNWIALLAIPVALAVVAMIAIRTRKQTFNLKV